MALVIREWDNPKDIERLKKYYEYEALGKLFERMQKEGLVKTSLWTKGVGHMVLLEEYGSLEDFAKAWNDKEYKEVWTRECRLVDNATCNVYRTSMSVPPE